MKRLVLLFLVFLALVSCQRSGVRSDSNSLTSAAHDVAKDELVLVASTDYHAALDRAEGFAAVIRGLKRHFGDHALFLDGGDLFQGSLEGNMSKGRSMVAFYNLIGIDAAAIGNHDLDYGVDVLGRINPRDSEDGLGNLKARAAEARFKWLSVNLIKMRPSARPKQVNALGQETIFAPHAVFRRAGRKACVIGATTPSTSHITNPAFIRGLQFTALAKPVQAEAKKLRRSMGCDWVVLVSHAGLSCDVNGRCLEHDDRADILRLLNDLPPGTLDAVVAGHTHKRAREVINGTPVIEAEHTGRTVGVLRLRLKDRSHRFEDFIDVPETADQPDVAALLKPYRDAAASLRNKEIGKATGPLPRVYNGESAIGNLIADALRQAGKAAAGTTMALANAGGVRGDIKEGTVTYGSLFKALPFDNSLAIVDVTGAELRRLLEIATSGGHGVAPVSGLKIKRLNVAPGQPGSWSRDLNGDGKKEDWERNLLLEVADAAGEPIQDDRRYKLATIDYLVMGGDHQNLIYDRVPANRKHLFPGIWIRDLVVEQFKASPLLDPSTHYDPKKPRIESIQAH